MTPKTLGFSTARGAIFRAKLDELAGALPGWRLPLPELTFRTVSNPFTGELIPNLLTRDPGPQTAPAVPPRLPFDAVILPSTEDWERQFLALDLALSDAPELSANVWNSVGEQGWLDVMRERELLVESLFGGDDDLSDPRTLHQLPIRLVELLAAARDRGVDLVSDLWQRHAPTPVVASKQYIYLLSDLASAALTGAQALHHWNIHPYHRDDSGKPDTGGLAR